MYLSNQIYNFSFDNYRNTFKNESKSLINIPLRAFVSDELIKYDNQLVEVNDIIKSLKSIIDIRERFEIVNYLYNRIGVPPNKKDIDYVDDFIQLDFDDNSISEQTSILILEDSYLEYLIKYSYEMYQVVDFLKGTIKSFDNIPLDNISLFDDIRNNEYSDYQLTSLLKIYSDNYNLDLLDSLRKDIWLYIETEKEDLECSFYSFEKEEAVNEWVKKGKEIPYLERKSFEELNENQKAKRLKLNIEIEPMIDFEKIMFPFEFYSVRHFQFKIIQKIDEIGKSVSFNTEIFTTKYAEELYEFLKLNYSNKNNHKYLYIYEYLYEQKYINVFEKDFEIFVFGKYKNLRYSDTLNRLNQISILKELENEFKSLK